MLVRSWFVKCVALLSVGTASTMLQADWPQFRGPQASSVNRNAVLPVEFAGEDNKNIAWKIDMPGRGVGGPILIGDQVIATSSAGVDQRRIYVTSVSQKDGKVLWQQEMVARGRPFCHPTSANAAPTPASDGKRIFAFFSSNDLVCYDLDGALLWYRALAIDYPKAGNDVGMSSSPIVADGVVMVQVECQGDSFVAGIDAETGKILWKNDRLREANWASPTVAKLPSGESIFVVQSMKTLEGLSPKTGQQLWTHDLRCSTIPSTAVADGKLFVPAKGMTTFALGSPDQAPAKLWDNSKLSSSTSSPLVSEEKIYCVNRSILIRANGATGEIEWQLRLPEAGSIWSSPVLGKTHLYLFTEDGHCFVVDVTGTEGVIAATNALGDGVLGSPALSDNSLFVRSANSLWKIAKP